MNDNTQTNISMKLKNFGKQIASHVVVVSLVLGCMYAFYLHGENQALKEQNVELQSSPYYQAQKIGEDRAVKKDALDKAKVARDDIYARTDKERAGADNIVSARKNELDQVNQQYAAALNASVASTSKPTSAVAQEDVATDPTKVENSVTDTSKNVADKVSNTGTSDTARTIAKLPPIVSAKK